jgi:hypothetical protein
MAESWLATAWIGSERLRDVLGGVDIATALAVHPALPPGFTRAVVVDGDRVTMTMTPETRALIDLDQPGWVGALARGERLGLEGIVHALDRTALVDRVENTGDAIEIAITLATEAQPVHTPGVVEFMRIGMLSSWKFDL